MPEVLRQECREPRGVAQAASAFGKAVRRGLRSGFAQFALAVAVVLGVAASALAQAQNPFWPTIPL